MEPPPMTPKLPPTYSRSAESVPYPPSAPQNGRLRSVRAFAVGTGLGLAVSAFFWVPALLESQHVQLDLLGGGIYDFRTWLFDPLRTGPTQPSLTFDYTALGRAIPERISPWQAMLWVAFLLLCLTQLRRPTARETPPSRGGCSFHSAHLMSFLTVIFPGLGQLIRSFGTISAAC